MTKSKFLKEKLVNIGDRFTVNSNNSIYKDIVMKIISVSQGQAGDSWAIFRTDSYLKGKKNHKVNKWWLMDDCTKK